MGSLNTRFQAIDASCLNGTEIDEDERVDHVSVDDETLRVWMGNGRVI